VSFYLVYLISRAQRFDHAGISLSSRLVILKNGSLKMDINAINKENAVIIRSCEKAVTDLKRAWGKGDPKGRKQVLVLSYIMKLN